MALVIAVTALAAMAVLLGVLARVEERLLADPEVREASRCAPMTSRAVAARAGGQAGAAADPVVAGQPASMPASIPTDSMPASIPTASIPTASIPTATPQPAGSQSPAPRIGVRREPADLSAAGLASGLAQQACPPGSQHRLARQLG